jgi:splicing factor 1
MARDCTVNKDPNAPPPPMPQTSRGGFDSEYASLMAELGETTGASNNIDLNKPSWAAGPSGGHDITGGGTNIPPWRRPENWQTNNPPQNQGYRPPQAGVAQSGGGYGWGGGGGGGGGYSQQAGYPQDYPNYASYYQGQYAQQQAS